MFELTALGRVKGSDGPILLIPLFVARNSNHTYVHVLNKDHVIQRFQRANTRYFDIFPYYHRQLFIEGNPGLFSIDFGGGRLFIGTHAELQRWWVENKHIVERDSLIEAIIIEIVSDQSAVKYGRWREYASKHTTGFGELSELASGKLELFQRYDQFWAEIDEDKREQEANEEDWYKQVISRGPRDIDEWLRNTENFDDLVWSWVWEHADKVFLDTEASKEMIINYLEYVIDEHPDFVDQNLAYILKRTSGFDALEERDKEILKRLFLSKLGVAKTGKIDDASFKGVVAKLYEGDEGACVVDLIDTLHDVSRSQALAQDGGVDQDILRVILELIANRRDGRILTENQIRKVAEFYISIPFVLRVDYTWQEFERLIDKI